MNGLTRLSEQEKKEMVDDSKNLGRGTAFYSARILSENGSLDDFIDFISENIQFFKMEPSIRITSNFKL
jgi:hypothetical protein